MRALSIVPPLPVERDAAAARAPARTARPYLAVLAVTTAAEGALLRGVAPAAAACLYLVAAGFAVAALHAQVRTIALLVISAAAGAAAWATFGGPDRRLAIPWVLGAAIALAVAVRLRRRRR